MGHTERSQAGDIGATSLSIAEAPWFGGAGVQAIFRALNRDGHEARIVGGAVRNTLLGRPVGDVDFATTAAPDKVARFARDAGLKPVATGLKHGTQTIVVEGVPFEVTTLREDVESHGRHATVAFTRDWVGDAQRRDFTMNALYAAADGRVYDPLGGIADLEARRVRFIGVARDRIREDYLRILRFFRFTAEYGEDGLDPAGFHAAVEERAGIAGLSAERIHAELWRILTGSVPMRALEPMTDGGFLDRILGGVVRLNVFERMAEIEARHGLERDAVRRIAALAVMVDEDAARLTVRLRLSNAEAVRLADMAATHPVFERHLTDAQMMEQLYRLGEHSFRERVLIAWAQSGDSADEAAWWQLVTLPERWTPPEFPVKGADLLTLGMERGPQIGETLRALEKRWVESGFALGRDELLGPCFPGAAL